MMKADVASIQLQALKMEEDAMSRGMEVTFKHWETVFLRKQNRNKEILPWVFQKECSHVNILILAYVFQTSTEM